ncbi:uncharacterized protein B0T15DRAFT_24912 [Chaetomium strumarium]|uniref:Uncharacterized protein n=1 Tax=Chaetomium strumarium TaxID=1170767 RepID=A0AAJ0M5R5_9PEZI|nr:hypothetical protein B0T15DRAFT_24912 [Chaetomium strumarium]
MLDAKHHVGTSRVYSLENIMICFIPFLLILLWLSLSFFSISFFCVFVTLFFLFTYCFSSFSLSSSCSLSFPSPFLLSLLCFTVLVISIWAIDSLYGLFPPWVDKYYGVPEERADWSRKRAGPVEFRVTPC